MHINNTVEKQMEIRYTDAFYSKRANVVTIVNYFNEVAQKAGNYYDMEKNILEDESLAWIILNWDIEISRYPDYLERVTVKTIAHSIDRYIAFREFIIEDMEKKIIARGKSKWILINLKRRRPAMARDYMYALYGVTGKESPFTIKNPPSINHDQIEPVHLKVSRTDIDNYDHVNNSVYIRWLYNSLPSGFSEERELCRIRVFYKREIDLGKEIRVYNQYTENGRVLHKITDSSKKTLVLAETFWR